MASFDVINYSLRPSKSIERQIIFESLYALKTQMSLQSPAYIGFGSIWFTDFVMAHRMLGIETMVSMEADDVGYSRAVFNKPYKTVKVLKGMSSDILPDLFISDYASKPWIIWLDYDKPYSEMYRDDIRMVIERSPKDSILLVTVNGHPAAYGQPIDRPNKFRQLFGDLVPDDFSKDDCKDEIAVCSNLTDFISGYMQSVAEEAARPGGFVPAFKIPYRDGSPMVTVGGVLPIHEKLTTVRGLVGSSTWKGFPSKAIVAPHLTIREALLLQSRLPEGAGLSRAEVQELGFDLQEEQIEAFQTYYLQYPLFAQVYS